MTRISYFLRRSETGIPGLLEEIEVVTEMTNVKMMQPASLDSRTVTVLVPMKSSDSRAPQWQARTLRSPIYAPALEADQRAAAMAPKASGWK